MGLDFVPTDGVNMKKKKRPNSRKRFVIIALLGIAVLILGTQTPKLVIMYRLNTFAQQLFDYPLPPLTTEISRETQTNQFGGSANFCHYEAILQVMTHLNKSELEAYYEDLMIVGVDGQPLNNRSGFHDNTVMIQGQGVVWLSIHHIYQYGHYGIGCASQPSEIQ